MAIPEQFSLRWNDFHSNLSQGFHALLECEDLVDVTLAAGGQYVHAHKLILSVCSPYFKELFKMNPCEHPIVILKDVALSELRQLLQFMYKGEVHVRQQELSGFLQTAELLQVKGLTAGREKSESPPPVSKPQEEQFSNVKTEQCNDSNSGEWVPGGDETIAMETSAPSSTEPTNQDEDPGRSPLKRLLKNTPNKTNMNSNKKKSRPSNDNSYAHENIEYGSDGEPMLDFDSDMVYHSVLEMPEHNKDLVKIKQEGMVYQHVLDMSDHGKNSILKIKQDGGWNCKTGGVKCPSCHRFFANRYNLKVHIRDKHDTLEGTLQCEICHKRMRNPSCLRVHMYHHRKQAAFLAAQLTPGGQMDPEQKNMIANMSGKWRSDGSPLTSPLTAADYKDQDSLIALAAGEDSSQPSADGDSGENA